MQNQNKNQKFSRAHNFEKKNFKMPKKFPDKLVKTSKPNLEEQFRLKLEKDLQEFKDNHELERKIFIFTNFFL